MGSLTEKPLFEPAQDGLLVQVAGVAVSDWLSTSDQNAIRLGALVRLFGDGEAMEVASDTLRVPWAGVAALSWEELRRSGLPASSPLTLEIESSRAIAHPDFAVVCRYVEDGRHVLVRRQGAWLAVGDRRFTLLDPLYSVVEAFDQYDPHAMADIEDRMKWWGETSQLLPEDVVLDGHLRSLRVVVAATFRLEPFRNSAGEPDFDPIPGEYVGSADEPNDAARRFADVLDDERQASFRRYFRTYGQARKKYPVGGGTYVFFTAQAVRALNIVRHAQHGTAEERLAFLEEPHSYLRDTFSGAEDDREASLDDVFCDHGLSERVHGIGVWEGKKIPWTARPAQPWLPPEEVGVMVDGTSLPITVDELPNLHDRLTAAADKGMSYIDFGGARLAVTDATIAEVRLLINEHLLVVPRPRDADKPETALLDHVLRVIDNLEIVGFRRRRKPRAGRSSKHRLALHSMLLTHQDDGIRWLHRHYEDGSWGALLADDMGLGKTLQAMAFLQGVRALMREGRVERLPMLVVAPTGLLKNWEDEHKKHLVGSGLGNVVRGYGRWLQRLRRKVTAGGELVSGRPVLDVDELRGADWVLTTYETLRDYQHSFGYVRWGVGVFDEAQKIKNPNTKTTEAALAMNVDFALLMTGTPVENRPADIWSILDRCEPGAFGPLKEFSRRYERDDASHDALRTLHAALTESTTKITTPPIMLRRLKEDHISKLPPKEVCRLSRDMPDVQAAAYARIVYESRLGVSPLKTLHQLRNISLHPGAPDDDHGIDGYIGQSARLMSTFQVLEEVCCRGEKALLFIESRQMQGFLLAAIRRKFEMAEDILVINGAVSGQARKARVDRFQERSGFDVMLLSPRAGGVGLTLTAANHVIHLSRWWNPAVEDQCTDRVYRIGQLHPVRVYVPLARHPSFGEYSFDFKLDDLLEKKRAMNRSVLAPVGASRDDADRLLLDTTERAQQHASAGGHGPGSDERKVPDGKVNGTRTRGPLGKKTEREQDVSIMEPDQFERWVLGLLREAGYDAQATPRSGDRGADGIARSADGRHTLVVQCKHTQGRRPCGAAAIDEVCVAMSAYDIQGEGRPVVITNALRFSARARKLAQRHGVRLVNAPDHDAFRRALSSLTE